MVSTRGQTRERKNCKNKENKSKNQSIFNANKRLKKLVASKSKSKPDAAKEGEVQPSTSHASPIPHRRNPRRNINDKPTETATKPSPSKESLPVPKEQETKQKEERKFKGKHKLELEEDNKPSTSSSESAPKPAKQARNEDESVFVIDLDNINRYWTPPDYSKPNKLLIRELLRCQLCMRTFSDVSSALKCLQSHGSEVVNFLRCYCCYKIFAGTTDLLDHYREEHNPGIRVDTLICPFCSDNVSVPYRNVSTHVVAYHAKDLKKRLAFNPNDKRAKQNPAPPSITVRDSEMMSAATYLHQLSTINPNRFAKCDCKYC